MTTGHESKQFWTSSYSKLLDIAMHIAGEDGPELLHETYLSLHGKALGDNPTAYVVRCLQLNYCSSTSRWHYKMRVPKQRERSIIADLLLPAEFFDRDAALELIEEARQQLPFFERELFRLYYSGTRLVDISRGSGIPHGVIHRAVVRARKHIRDEVQRAWGHRSENH